MKDERWAVIDRLLGAALEQERQKRAAFLRQACGGDEELRREVESLLGHEEGAGDFLERPPLRHVATFATSTPALLAKGREVGPFRFSTSLASVEWGRSIAPAREPCWPRRPGDVNEHFSRTLAGNRRVT
jgi:hypothetical protein